MTTSNFRRLIASSGVIAFLTSQSARCDVIVYNNTTNDKTNRFSVPNLLEVGDEINLGGTPAQRSITTFSFEYFGLNLAGDEQAIVKFYANDGPQVSPSGPRMPGTVLWNSGSFTIGNTPRATLTFDITALNIVVPTSFTWAVQFNLGANTSGNEAAGLDIYSPPTIGTNYEDYWEHVGSSWVLKVNNLVNMDFAARINAVPEPSSMALFGVAAMGLVLAWKRRQS